MKYPSGKNKERVKKYNKSYYQKNREKLLKRGKKYREENKEYYREYSRRHYQEHKDERSKYYQTTIKKNKLTSYNDVENHITGLLTKYGDMTYHELWNKTLPHIGGKIGLTTSKFVGRLRAHPNTVVVDGKWMLRGGS